MPVGRLLMHDSIHDGQPALSHLVQIAFRAPETSWASQPVDQPGVNLFEALSRVADYHETGQPVVEAPQGQGQLLVSGCLGQQVVEALFSSV
jgi:hypothetical protein